MEADGGEGKKEEEGEVMGDKTLGERVMDLEGLINALSERVLVLEGEKVKREKWRKQGEMVQVGGRWVRKGDE